MARPPLLINMSDTDKQDLELVLRSKKVESRIKERAKIIMLWYEGKTYDETTAICAHGTSTFSTFPLLVFILGTLAYKKH